MLMRGALRGSWKLSWGVTELPVLDATSQALSYPQLGPNRAI